METVAPSRWPCPGLCVTKPTQVRCKLACRASYFAAQSHSGKVNPCQSVVWARKGLPIGAALRHLGPQALLDNRRNQAVQRPAVPGDFAHQLRAQIAVA